MKIELVGMECVDGESMSTDNERLPGLFMCFSMV